MAKKITLVCFYALLSISSHIRAAEVVSSTSSLSNTPHIRALAASCAACHGTNGNAVISNSNSTNADSSNPTFKLAGIDGQYFVAQMLAFKNGSRPATVMHQHAKGLHEDEINLLAIYFSQQKPMVKQTLQTQKLKANHE